MHERNPYLNRTHSNTPHSFSYDMQTGKYYLEHSGNVHERIEKTGRLPTRFKSNGSGVFTSKQRYEQAKTDKHCLHFVPDLSYHRHRSLYTPITDKFLGYAQFPFKAQMPQHLEIPHQKAQKIAEGSQKVVRRHFRRQQMKKKLTVQENMIKPDNTFFEMSMAAMSTVRPPPPNRKKTCYDSKCRFQDPLKKYSVESIGQYVKDKSLLSTAMNETLNRSYFQKRLKEQMT